MKLSIVSSGVVCSGGFGSDALFGKWVEANVSNATRNREHRVFLVNREAGELRRWEKEPRLRRASPISYYLIEAANQALEQVPHLDRKRVGVVSAFFLGCLVYTIRFFHQITEEGRRSASPIIFPETVFNSPLSHVVSALGIGGPVYSQVGDTSCWSNALRTAQVWLMRGTADHVLVLGAEEFDPHQLDAFHAGGLFRQSLCVGEGAGAILLGREEVEGGASLLEVNDGFSFGDKKQAARAVQRCMENVPLDCAVMDTASGWMRPLAARAIGNRRILLHVEGLSVEASTASCAWNTICAAAMLAKGDEEKIAVPFWGLSQQCGMALCGR